MAYVSKCGQAGGQAACPPQTAPETAVQKGRLAWGGPGGGLWREAGESGPQGPAKGPSTGQGSAAVPHPPSSSSLVKQDRASTTFAVLERHR